MLVSCKGIVLRKTLYNDTTFMVSMYTSELGLKTFSIKRSAKVKTNGHMGLMQVIDLVFDHQDRKQIHFIKESKIRQGLINCLQSPAKFCQLQVLNEILNKCVKEEEQNLSLFAFIEDRLNYLEAAEGSNPLFLHQTLMQLTQWLGFMPDVEGYSEQTPYLDLINGVYVPFSMSAGVINKELSYLVYQLCNDTMPDHIPPQIIRNELLTAILSYYNYHIANFGTLKTLDVIAELFA